MRASTVHELHGIDVAGNVRAEMARANVSASMLSRIYGGSVTYWTRRMKGELEFTAEDLQRVAEATMCHPAILLGGEAPSGWTPPTTRVRDRIPNFSKGNVIYLSRHPYHRFSALRSAS